MVPMTAEHSRETLTKLVDTRRAVANAPEKSFNQNRWGFNCGTPACTLGWATTISKGELQIRPSRTSSDMIIRHLPTRAICDFAAIHFYRCSGTVAQYICSPAEATPESLNEIIGKSQEAFNILSSPWRLKSRDGALVRLDVLINRERRRLATLEVEEGQWGRPLKAKDAPVGRAREVAVQEKLEAVLV